MDALTPEIEFSDFLKVDIRSGTVTGAEKVEKSEKLLKLAVHFGAEIGTRTILAGIGKSFEPEALVGVRVLAVVNLAPRKMMGFESHGMLLAATADGGGLTLASCVRAADGERLG